MTNLVSPRGGFAVNNVPALDGFRGLLAIWVLLSHVTQFVDGPRGLIDRGGIAVDLFMLVSGFLMFWNVESRFERENPSASTTWQRFFVRRFFRIVPLYYLALLASLLFEGYLKSELRAIYQAQGLGFDRPFEACVRDFGANVFLHITFIFGFDPCYAASNVIPDWSLSLEMQFYLCFPILYFAFKRWPSLPLVVVAAVCVGVASRNISVYSIDVTKWLSYPQPSVLALRLNCFVAGIVLAKVVCSYERSRVDLIALLLSLILFQRLTFAVIGFGFALVILRQDVVKYVRSRIFSISLGTAAKMLEAPISRSLGDLSYGVYLIHIFILIPLVRALQSTGWFLDLNGVWRFALVTVLVVPLALLLAKLTFEVIEKPFIKVGRKVANRLI